MKLENLVNIYQGSNIGILGSGPTLLDYIEEIYNCDVIIACNGSLMALNPISTFPDFFLCTDINSHKRRWFTRSKDFRTKVNKKVIRILPNFLLPHDPIVVESSKLRKELLEEYNEFMKKNEYKDSKCYRDFIPENFISLDNGVNISYSGNLLKDLNGVICGSGTVTGIASQIAFKMGANKISLFGCGFDNESGVVYAYDNGKEPGGTNENHRLNMDTILHLINSSNVEICSYGKTNLTEPKILL